MADSWLLGKRQLLKQRDLRGSKFRVLILGPVARLWIHDEMRVGIGRFSAHQFSTAVLMSLSPLMTRIGVISRRGLEVGPGLHLRARIRLEEEHDFVVEGVHRLESPPISTPGRIA